MRGAALAVAMSAVAPGATSAQSLSYVGGLQYATGDFIFTQRTWSAYLSNGLVWSEGRLRASASVPLVMQPSGWVQYSGAGIMVPTGGMAGSAVGPTNNGSSMGSGMNGGTMTPASGASFSRVGIGDPIGRVDVALWTADTEHPSVSLVGAVKAPLADVSSGFGTGEWDVGAGLSGAASVHGTSVFGEAVYWKLGNPPGASLRGAVAYALSIGRALPRSRWSLLGTVFGASSLWTGLEAPVQVGMGAGYLLESGSSVFATAAGGLTRTAPAISIGLGWRVPLGKTR
jgi:hypothetical protein